MGQIIAIGGGGFGRNPNKPIIEKYIVDQSDKKKPRGLFIPTASAGNRYYTVNYYSAFTQLNCNRGHLGFCTRTPRLDSLINKQDIIYVGGGNTKSMLAVWREWKLDNLLLKAYNRGAILCGVSAGSICWFEKLGTDSFASYLNVMYCIFCVYVCCCPHYDGEKDRRPSVGKFIMDKKIETCLAADDGAALHYKDGKLYTAVTFYEDAGVYEVSLKNGEVHHENIKSIYIG